jgi:hypothetical protein
MSSPPDLFATEMVELSNVEHTVVHIYSVNMFTLNICYIMNDVLMTGDMTLYHPKEIIQYHYTVTS